MKLTTKVDIMEKDRKQVTMLLCLVAPAVMLWVSFGAFFAYDMGKNGLHNINWSWILQNSIPVIIIATAMFFQGIRLQRAYKQNTKY